MGAAWSYSALNAFEQCPRRYKLTRVDKIVKEGDTDATLWGKRVHSHLEERVRDGTPLPQILSNLEPIASSFDEPKGELIVERKMCVTENLSPTTFFAKDAWCRGVIDVGVVGKSSALIADWKTGKRKEDADQLKLFAGMAFAHWPNLKRVHTMFVWIKDMKTDTETFTREQVGDIWSSFLPRVRRLDQAFEQGRWPANPSGLCRKYCPVGKVNCEFCGQ